MKVSVLIYYQSGNLAIACFAPNEQVVTALIPLISFVQYSNTFLHELYQTYKLQDESISEIKFKTEVSREVYHYIHNNKKAKIILNSIYGKIRGV